MSTLRKVRGTFPASRVSDRAQNTWLFVYFTWWCVISSPYSQEHVPMGRCLAPETILGQILGAGRSAVLFSKVPKNQHCTHRNMFLFLKLTSCVFRVSVSFGTLSFFSAHWLDFGGGLCLVLATSWEGRRRFHEPSAGGGRGGECWRLCIPVWASRRLVVCSWTHTSGARNMFLIALVHNVSESPLLVCPHEWRVVQVPSMGFSWIFTNSPNSYRRLQHDSGGSGNRKPQKWMNWNT